jgi:hypothetical protein
MLRDHDGSVLVTSWGMINHCLIAEMAKVISFKEGVKAILAIATS